MSQHTIQLSRYSVDPTALENLSAAWLPFPFAGALERFRQAIQVQRPKNNVWVPYRQLNNALLACAPTLTHGFEKTQTNTYRALVVGTSQNPLCPPTPDQLQLLTQIWASRWIRELVDDPVLRMHGDTLKEELSKVSLNFQWQNVKPSSLITDISYLNGLAFPALPSLLATLLHGQTMTIGSNQIIQWRKVQGDGADQTGLYVVSQPFKGQYATDDKGSIRDGYFAYRLDFRVQTQAGRFNARGKSEPWIFMTLSCQRYAHELVSKFPYGRNVSVLTGVRQARLSGYNIDNTMVRLVIENRGPNNPLLWRDQLPDVLESFGARKLVDPDDLKTNPAKFANIHNVSGWQDDEYLIIHTEGLHYESRKRNHALKTGFAFDERRAILDGVLELLGGVLIPDTSLPADLPTPSGIKTPLAMRNYTHFETKAKKQQSNETQEKQSVISLKSQKTSVLLAVQEAIRKVLPGQKTELFILHQNHTSGRLILEQLKELFGLKPNDPLPDWFKVQMKEIPDNGLLDPLEKPIDIKRQNQDTHWRREHVHKRETWSAFLAEFIPAKQPPALAIVEMPVVKQSEIAPQQSIKGAVREACARANISSQVIQVMQTQLDNNNIILKDESVYRVKNALLDALVRHTGTLFGSPSEIYKQAGFSIDVANRLEVITLYRHQKQPGYGDIHYALAVRLRATGEVDILLPDQQEWIPYLQAGPALGRLFAEARKEPLGRRNPDTSKVKLSNSRLLQFLTHVLTRPSPNPTLLVLDAEVWRNARTEEGKIWPQIQNGTLAKERDILSINGSLYSRSHAALNHIVGIIRLRDGIETPDYLPGSNATENEDSNRDYAHLSGFIDWGNADLMHYFSVGRLPETQKKQRDKRVAGLFKIEKNSKGGNPRFDDYGANTAFKHQQAIEMIPFFVRSDLQHEAGLLSLCRAAHWLRISPAWSAGNTVLPYPMHLAKCLIEDQLCILSSK